LPVCAIISPGPGFVAFAPTAAIYFLNYFTCNYSQAVVEWHCIYLWCASHLLIAVAYQRTYFMTNLILTDRDTRKAFGVIREFFNSYGFSDALKQLDSILNAACSDKVWKKEVPANLLYFMDGLAALCEAAFVLYGQPEACGHAVIAVPETGEPDLLQLQHFISKHSCQSVWSYFPRHLSSAQYHHPYKALEKFFRHMPQADWRVCLKRIGEAALGNEAIGVVYPEYHLLRLRKRLMVLIEAGHLLLVRSSLNTGDSPIH
jgi:hypothetical protein